MDLRARDYTRGRQLTLASDLVFTDGFDLTKKAGEAIERAVTAEVVARDAAGAIVQQQQAMALGGARRSGAARCCSSSCRSSGRPRPFDAGPLGADLPGIDGIAVARKTRTSDVSGVDPGDAAGAGSGSEAGT